MNRSSPTERMAGSSRGLAAAAIRPMQLSDEVASHLRALIMSGHFIPGEYIRVERVADQLGVSATPVREALLVIRGEGFVQLVPNRGFRVASLSKRDIADLFLVQTVIAAELAARAAERMSSETAKEIEHLQEAMQQASEQHAWDAIADLNFEFHRVINHTAESPKLAWFLGIAIRYVPRPFHAEIAGWLEASLTDHAAVIDALRARDAEQARQAMSRHVTQAGELLMAHLEKQGFWSGMHDRERGGVDGAAAEPRGRVAGAPNHA